MPNTIPTISYQIDSYFMSIWDVIVKEKQDNILLPVPLYAWLKKKGRVVPQAGGNNVDFGVRYAVQTPIAFGKGDVMPAGELESTTQGRAPYRNIAVGLQRTLIDDVACSGESRIVDYVRQRIEDAQDGLRQQFEIELWGAFDDGTSPSRSLHYLSLNDMIPSNANKATGTYCDIARSNTWWQAKYHAASATPAVNLLNDWRNLFNTCWNNQEPPDFVMTDQTQYEIYQDFLLNSAQIVKPSAGNEGDLGFTAIYFNQMPVVFSANITAGDTIMLNTSYIWLKYEPQAWMYMTPWKESPDNLERKAQIVCRATLYSNQLRRHGRNYTA